MKFKRLFQKQFYPVLERYYLIFYVEVFKSKRFFILHLKNVTFFLVNIEYIY